MIDIQISDFDNAALAAYMCIWMFVFSCPGHRGLVTVKKWPGEQFLRRHIHHNKVHDSKNWYTQLCKNSNYAKKSSDLSQICKVGADIYKTLCRSHWRRRKFMKYRFYHFKLHLEAVLLIVFTIYIIASCIVIQFQDICEPGRIKSWYQLRSWLFLWA